MEITETSHFWGMIYALEFTVLGRIIFDNFLKDKLNLIIPWKIYNIVGLSAVLIGTSIYLISYAGLFMFDVSGDFCMVAELSQDKVNQTKAENCLTNGFDLKLNLFLWGGIGTVIILIGNTFQSIPFFKSKNKDNRQENQKTKKKSPI